LVLSLNAKDDNELRFQLVVILGRFALIVVDDNMSFGLLSFSAFFSLGVKDDEEPGGLSLFLGFIRQVQKMMMS
jgi:hypothetical protein